MSGASIYDNANKPTVAIRNPLDLMQQAGAVAASQNANKLFQAQQAAGQAYQNSIGPDGTPNQAQLLTNLKAAGAGAALASQTSAQAGQTLDSATQNQQLQKLNYISGINIGLLTQKGPIDPQQAIDQINAHVKDGVFTPAQAQTLTSSVPQNTPQNPDAVRQWIAGHTAANLNAQGQIAATFGTPGTRDTGQEILSGPVAGPLSPNFAAFTPAGQPTQKVTGPETNAAQSNQWIKDPRDPTGQSYIQVPVPRSAMPGASGIAPPAQGAQPAPIPYTGTYRPRGPVVGAATQPAAPAASVPAPAAPGAVQPAAAPAAEAAASPPYLSAPPQGQPDQLAAGNKIYNDAAAAKPDQQKRLIAGENALQALDLARTGPGTGTINKMAAWLNSKGEDTSGVDLNSTAAYQVLQKQLLRFAQASGKSSGTDLGLETQLHSNANTDSMLNSANRHVLVQDVGILKRDMTQTDTMPQGAAAIEHVKTFANGMDPQAFSWDHYTPEQRASIIATAQKNGTYDKLRSSLQAALKSGYVKPDAQAAPAPVQAIAPTPSAAPAAPPQNALQAPHAPY